MQILLQRGYCLRAKQFTSSYLEFFSSEKVFERPECQLDKILVQFLVFCASKRWLLAPSFRIKRTGMVPTLVSLFLLLFIIELFILNYYLFYFIFNFLQLCSEGLKDLLSLPFWCQANSYRQHSRLSCISNKSQNLREVYRGYVFLQHLLITQVSESFLNNSIAIVKKCCWRFLHLTSTNAFQTQFYLDNL